MKESVMHNLLLERETERVIKGWREFINACECLQDACGMVVLLSDGDTIINPCEPYDPCFQYDDDDDDAIVWLDDLFGKAE